MSNGTSPVGEGQQGAVSNCLPAHSHFRVVFKLAALHRGEFGGEHEFAAF